MINEVIYEDGTRISRNGAIISVEWIQNFHFRRTSNWKDEMEVLKRWFWRNFYSGLFVAGETNGAMPSQLSILLQVVIILLN